MQKILIIHTKYRNFGGEDTAVENEFELLKEFFDVRVLYFKNTIEKFNDLIAFFTRKNKKSMQLLQREIDIFNPDLVYVHNTWFKASLGIFQVLEKNKINTLLKLHNFRYKCTRSFLTSKHFENDNFCQACGLEKKDLGVFNKYYLNSFFKSLVVNHYGKKYFTYLLNSNINLAVLTKFHRDYLINFGLEKNRIFIIPNHINFNSKTKYKSNSNYLVYAGRVSKEKGVFELIKAFEKHQNKNIALKIIGTGPSFKELKTKYQSDNIHFMGELPNAEVLKQIKNSKAVITATKLLEGQPMLLCEASVIGVPSLYPITGGVAEFFPNDCKLSFNQYDYDNLQEKLNLLDNHELLQDSGKKNQIYINSLLNKELIIDKFNKVISKKNE